MKKFIIFLGVMGLLFLFTFAGEIFNSETQQQLTKKLEIGPDDKPDSAINESTMQNIWVFFKDKGVTNHLQYKHAIVTMANKLTQKSMERRKKVLKKNNLITFEDIPVCEDYVTKVKQLGVKIRTKSRWLNAISVNANAEQLEKIREFPFVQEVKGVAVFRVQQPLEAEAITSTQRAINKINSSNFDYGLSFEQLQHIRVPEVHQLGLSGKGVRICIMDAGFRKDHEVFQQANIVAERDFIFNDNDTQTDPTNPFDSSDRHGTITWSNLGGFKEGKLIGPAYDADFLLAKTENTQNETPAEEDYWVAAVEWADSLGAQIISSSLGYFDWYRFEDLDGNTATITRAANHAVKLGIVVVTSAGNWRKTDWGHINPPADGDSVIAVGAFNIFYNTYASFSSPGPTYDGRIKPEVVASGVNNYSADNSAVNDYKRISGTSVSCPLVAGVAALILEQHPTWTPSDVRNALMYTASQHNHPDNDLGWGVVDAYKAVFDTNVVISIKDVRYDDSHPGNSNGLPEPGENIMLNGIVSCVGKIEQNNYVISLKTNDPFIRLSDSVESVHRLVSYGQVELKSAFSFIIDQNVPENHPVEFKFTIKDEIGNSWEQFFVFHIVIQRTITGMVSNSAGSGITNAIVTWTKINPDSNKIIDIDTVRTDRNGKYLLSLVGGQYSVQVLADGYSTEDARVISIPTMSSPLNFVLKIADFKLEPDYFTIDLSRGNNFTENLMIYNTGSAPLFYIIQEDIDDSININDPILIPEILLRSDPNDGLPYDLKGIACEQNSSQLALKITTFQEIKSKQNWNLSIFLDADVDPTTGHRAGRIGADYQISYFETKTSLLKYNDGVWQNITFTGSTAVGKTLLQFRFNPALIDNPKKFQLVVMLYDGESGDSRIVRDSIPDASESSNVTYSRYKSNWLSVKQPTNIIPPQSSSQAQLLFSFTNSLMNHNRTRLILQTNSPISGETVIPINYSIICNNTAGENNNISPAQFSFEQNVPNPFNSQTAIRFSLPCQSKVKLTIFNSIGQKIIVLNDSALKAGVHTFFWNGRNEHGVDVCSGVYFIKFEADKWSKMIKSLLVR